MRFSFYRPDKHPFGRVGDEVSARFVQRLITSEDSCHLVECTHARDVAARGFDLKMLHFDRMGSKQPRSPGCTPATDA